MFEFRSTCRSDRAPARRSKASGGAADPHTIPATAREHRGRAAGLLDRPRAPSFFSVSPQHLSYPSSVQPTPAGPARSGRGARPRALALIYGGLSLNRHPDPQDRSPTGRCVAGPAGRPIFCYIYFSFLLHSTPVRTRRPRGVTKRPRGPFEPRTYRPERHITICDARPRAGDGADAAAGPAVEPFLFCRELSSNYRRNR